MHTLRPACPRSVPKSDLECDWCDVGGQSHMPSKWVIQKMTVDQLMTTGVVVLQKCIALLISA